MSVPKLPAPRRALLAVAAVALLAAACSGSSDGSGSAASTTATSSTAGGGDGGLVDLGPTTPIDPDDAPLFDANGPGPAVEGGLYDVPDPLPAGEPGELIASEP